jgi:hypothetical protein
MNAIKLIISKKKNNKFKPMNPARFILLMFIIAVTLSASSCSPSINTTGSWVNKERKTPQQPYKSVFIVVLTDNLETKTTLENDIATAARAKGFKTYTSMESFGPISGKEGLPVKEAFLKKVADLNCETIFSVALVDKQSETRYVPGSSYAYTPYPRYGYYGMFGGYYNYASTSFYSPGYYSTDKTFFLESNLYDAKTEELLASIQSKAENPPAIQKSSKLYTESLIKELESLGLLKK